MYYSLTGTLRAKGEDPTSGDGFCALECGGVAYQLLCSPKTLGQLPELGEPCALFTRLLVRPDALILVGFHGRDERDLFHLLQGANGVGGRRPSASSTNSPSRKSWRPW